MEKKTFEISRISSVENVNALSIALNDKEQVSHMKIGKTNITFNCIDIEELLSDIHAIDKDIVVKEVIGGQKREYDFAQRKEKTYYFMFKNIVNQEDIQLLTQRLSQDPRYHDVHYNEQNELLILISSRRDVLSLLRKELFKINPSTEIIEHRRPIRSQDVFNQRYIKTYIRIALLFLMIALAVVTSKDETWMTPALWTVAVLLLSERIIREALKQIKLLRFFHPDVIFVIAIIMGLVSGVYIELCMTVFIYLMTRPFLNIVLRFVMNRVNNAAQIPEKATYFKNDQEIETPLDEFEIGDIMVVHPQEVVMIPGIVKRGTSQVNTYPNTSTYELLKVKFGSQLNSGDINVGDQNLYIQITDTYHQSHYTKLMNIASKAPVYESKIEKWVKILTRFYTPTMFLISLIIGVVLPIIDYRMYGPFIHIGAVFMILATTLPTDQATSISVLSGFAKAFQDGIILESSLGLDSINETQTIVYDRFDGIEVTDEELELFHKLSHMGRQLVIFNDGPVALENDQYTIYNDLSIEEKLEVMDNLIGPIVYIGDSFKDVALLQKSYVGISRGGIADSKVVENSDIVLIDSSLHKVYETFAIARSMRTRAIISSLVTVLSKLLLIIAVVVLTGLPLYIAVIVDILTNAFVLVFSTGKLD